ncbi:MAG TPA: glycosyltransferase family 4 protein [Xanthobacteraceae bacterium]|nr:glycosyltransferase family 4 protein [Xanthobacteraceae bacterium]
MAHFEAGRLEAFCVPWIPSEVALGLLCCAAPLRPMAQRLARRRFSGLSAAPKVQGRIGEWRRLMLRAAGCNDERLSYEANDWLMSTMTREVRRSQVTAVHAYEDCSLNQFLEAKSLQKACIYDMPIGYYPAWEQTLAELLHRFADWLPERGPPSQRFVRPKQKRREMELADLVMVPSSFVEQTIRMFCPEKRIARAYYGVDSDFWTPPSESSGQRPLRFIYAGQLSLRKGIPDLIEAWRRAKLQDAELELVGMWLLAENKRRSLPTGVIHREPLSAEKLRERYQNADVFVFPSYFEGFGLVLTEAMACGLPVIATTSTIGPDIIDDTCGRLVSVGDVDEMVEVLCWFSDHREWLIAMSRYARKRAEQLTWQCYREQVSAAVAPLV